MWSSTKLDFGTFGDFFLSNMVKCIMFADDTNLFCNGKSIFELLQEIEKEVVLTKKCFDYSSYL